MAVGVDVVVVDVYAAVVKFAVVVVHVQFAVLVVVNVQFCCHSCC